MLIILQELMHRTFVEIEGRAPKRHEIPKPCEHFDLIVGTGTGGLIAIMLGRLRLDLDTCKEVYVRMTRRVFETNKTFLGMPYKGTMFKASKLEEAIREVAREHTVFDDEGNDTLANATPMTPNTPSSMASSHLQRSLSQGSRYSSIGMGAGMGNRTLIGALARGNPNALLYDTREHRTKTAVAAVLKGTSVIALLRSYDSRKEPAPDVNCTIWQAGRATSATQMAFKPIQIGQSWYLDEGAGRYNPAPLVLDEAIKNEWPGREVGVFVSIGTGKRPPGTGAKQHEWWEDFMGGSMGEFAEARRKLISKLEGCEEIHKYMQREHLAARGVNPENYYRLNVEVGVGEFGMDEWSRLSEISASTRSYLSKKEVESMNQGASAKIAKIFFAKVRHDRAEARKQAGHDGPQYSSIREQNPWERPLPGAPPPINFAVELPGDESYKASQQQYDHRPSVTDQKYTVQPGDQQYMHRPSVADQKYTVTGDGYDRSYDNSPQQRPVNLHHSSPHNSLPHNSSPPHQSRTSNDYPNSFRFSDASTAYGNGSPRQSQDFAPHQHPQPPSSPPPVPPKTPTNGGLPYPDTDGPGSMTSPQVPPIQQLQPMSFMYMGELNRRLASPGPPPNVNMANKPTMSQ